MTGTLLRQDYINDTDVYFSWASEIYHSYVDKPIAISSAIFLVSQLEKIIDNQCIKFSFSELMNLYENSIGKLEALYSVDNWDLLRSM